MNGGWEIFLELATKFVAVCGILLVAFSLRFGIASFKKFGRLSDLIHTVPYVIYIIIFILIVQCVKEFIHQSLSNVLFLPAFVCLVLFLEKPSEVEIRDENLNLGGQLALWYYLGYLQLVLNPPSLYDSNDSQSIRRRIERYELQQNIKVISKKLFILIPDSCHIPREIPQLEICHKLKTSIIERSGNERKFDNPVYLINPDFENDLDIPIRCVVEGATPLGTLLNMSKQPHAKITEKQRKVHLDEFYVELQKLLEKDPACKNGCVLLKYDDTADEFNLKEYLIESIRLNA